MHCECGNCAECRQGVELFRKTMRMVFRPNPAPAGRIAYLESLDWDDEIPIESRESDLVERILVNMITRALAKPDKPSIHDPVELRISRNRQGIQLDDAEIALAFLVGE